jgi:glycosyltransferase involved in cell wall biosynthesis
MRSLVPELVRLAPDVAFSVFCNPRGREYLEREGWGDAVELVTHPLLVRRGLKAVSELTVLGSVAGRRVDLLHSVAMTAPLRTRAVNVVTLADITWIIAPDPGEAATMRLWRVIVPPVARRADRLLALSEAGAQHVVEYLRVPRERIDVVPLAAGGSDLMAPTPAAELRARLGLGDGPVILTVSAMKVHKNLERLVRAIVPLAERWPDVMLVMPGKPTPHERELRRLANELGLTANVVFPGYVDAPDLEGLYALASCFVFASINEGFGIPILEAMRRRVPVACSRASALPEVAGDAARYFDPYNIQDISDALSELLCDRQLAQDLVTRGCKRQATFTWGATARGTLDCYARAWRERQTPSVKGAERSMSS